MKTEILGGGSFKNKAWVDEIQAQLAPEIPTNTIYYNDWIVGKDATIDFEAETAKVLEQIGNEPFDMVAKSVGSYIGLGVIERTGYKVRKLVICGIPLDDFNIEELEKRYQVINSLPAENVIVFQNEFDNHGSYERAQAFLSKINPVIKLVKKTGEFEKTHNYPYPQDFKDFLLKT